MTTIGETARRISTAEVTVEPVVYVVDDDRLMREMLSSLFRSIGLRVRLFESAQEILQSELEDVPSCLVLDIRMPRLSGFDLQAELAKSNIRIPIIFLTGHGDVSTSVRAMKAGAVDFLTKPFHEQEMLDAVTAALECDQKQRSEERSHLDLQDRFALLSDRERQIMALVTGGLMNTSWRGQQRHRYRSYSRTCLMSRGKATLAPHGSSMSRHSSAKSLA
jgi:FixJ family two-component response regulator